MRRHGLWLAASLIAALGGCDQTPKGPPPLPNSVIDSSIPEAKPFIEPPANETAPAEAGASTAAAADLAAPANTIAAGASAAPTTLAAAPIPFGGAQDVIAADRSFRARQKRLEGLVDNAASRDPNGDAEADYRYALPARDACRSRACLNAWYAREEQALSKWEGAAEILAQPPR